MRCGSLGAFGCSIKALPLLLLSSGSFIYIPASPPPTQDTDVRMRGAARPVSHAALRDGSGHGQESEVKAITSWVALPADLPTPPPCTAPLSVFSPQTLRFRSDPVRRQVLSALVELSAHAKLRGEKKKATLK